MIVNGFGSADGNSEAASDYTGGALARYALHALDSLAAQVAIVDQQGTIRAVNRAWQAFTAANPPLTTNPPLTGNTGVGANYLAVCDAAQGEDAAGAHSFARLLRDVLAGHSPSAAHPYPCHAPHEQRWFVARIDPFVDDGQRCAIIAHENVTAQHLAEQALAESEARYRSLFENSHTVMFIIDPADGALVDANPAAAESYGWSRAQLRTMRISDINVLPAAELGKLMDQARGRARNQFQLRHRHADGSVHDVESFSGPIVHQGRTLLFSIVHDIGERVRAEAALRQSEANLAQAQSIAGLGSWEVDLATQHETWSDELYRLLGLTPGVDRPSLARIFDRLHPEDKSRARAAYTDLIATGRPIKLELCTDPALGPQQYFTCRAEAFPNSSGAVTRLAGTLVNITARKQAAAELQSMAERMAQVMRSVPEGVILLDPDRRILLTNARAEALLPRLGSLDPGGRLTTLGGSTLEELMAPAPSGAGRRLDSADRSYELLVSPVQPQPSVPGGWVIVLRDVTEARQVQLQLQRQERLAAVGQLAAGIAHDFNNLLSVIQMYAELVAGDPTVDERNRARLTTIQQQTQRAAQMIRQILDFSRRSVLELEQVALLPLFMAQVRLLRRALPEHIEIELMADAGELLVKGDPTRLEQVLMNLAINARDAMPEGGRLSIALAAVHVAAAAPVPGLPPGNWIAVSVRDSGAGIPETVLDHIFEPFFTTKAPGQGTGLGLAQVHGIIAQHGGQITAANHPAGGAVFTFYLPALEVLTPGAPAVNDNSIPHGHGETVLVVEDDDVLRLTLCEALDLWGYHSVAAGNGVQALDLLAAPDTHVDLVLSDVVMPQMGGVSLLKTLHERHSPLPVVLMTGHPLGEQLEGLYAIGLYRWLPKPPNTRELAQILASALRR